jgi:hypothetical protein
MTAAAAAAVVAAAVAAAEVAAAHGQACILLGRAPADFASGSYVRTQQLATDIVQTHSRVGPPSAYTWMIAAGASAPLVPWQGICKRR